MQRILQSATSVVTAGPFIDDTDFKTLKTGAFTLAAADCILIKAGGTSSAAKNEGTAPAFISNGHYAVTLNSTDSGTVGRMQLIIVKSGALIVREDLEVLPATSYNPMVAGTANWTTDITYRLKFNTGINNFHFTMTLTGTSTPATGKTVTCQRAIDGATSFSSMANSATEVASGLYRINLAAADLNGSFITYRFTEATCNDKLVHVVTQA